MEKAKVTVKEIVVNHENNPKKVALLSNGRAMAVGKEVQIGDEIAEEVWREWSIEWGSRTENLSWHDKRDRDWSRHMC
jgi:hypothetical protein